MALFKANARIKPKDMEAIEKGAEVEMTIKRRDELVSNLQKKYKNVDDNVLERIDVKEDKE